MPSANDDAHARPAATADALIANGVPDAAASIPVLKIVGPMNNCGGTAVLLDESWALTASHCLASLAPGLSLRSPRLPGEIVEIAEIHWYSGLVWRASTDHPLPPDAARYTGDEDQLVLMRLRKSLPDMGRSCSTVGPRLNEGDVLYIAGFGEDESGNYPADRFARVAATRYGGLGTNERGLLHGDPQLQYGGMPQSGDSGAPVFTLDVLDEKGQIRLVGIHSGRSRDDEQRVVGEFLPLDPDALSWIRETMDAKPDNERLARTPSANHFILRNSFTCRYVDDQFSLDNAADTDWFLVDVFSPSHRLSNCTAFTIADGKLNIKSDAVGQPIDLTREANGHWLSGTASDNSQWYVYQLADASAPVPVYSTGRRIRIEIYAANSLNQPPSLSNVADGQSLGESTVIVDPCLSNRLVGKLGYYQPDQDDQGSGHERRR